MEAGIGLGLAFADFILKNWNKRNWGEFRASCIDELSGKYPESRKILIDFLSEDEVYDMMRKLPKGSDTDFQNFLQAFQDFCKGSNYEFDSKEIIKQIKFGAELGEASTTFEQISIRYQQKASENDEELLKKMNMVHEDVKDAKKKIDQLGKNNQKESPKQYSADSKNYKAYIAELKSKLDLQQQIKFNVSFTGEQVSGNSVEELSGFIKSKRRVILQGAAGGGKSVVVTDLVTNLIDKNVLPILVKLGEFQDLSTELRGLELNDIDSQMDILLRVAKGTMNIELLKNFDGETWIIVDGLNEITAGGYDEETIRNILSVLFEYARRTAPKTYVLVADRLTSRGFAQNWDFVTLNPMSEEEVTKQLDKNLGAGKYGKLSKSDLKILSRPFFLDIALKRKSPSLGSESDALRDFFTKQFKLCDKELGKLAEAAFETYKRYGSLSFNLEEFEKVTGKEICKTLLGGGTIKKSEGGNASFDHQLMHDYLVSRYIAMNEERWDFELFDIATLESNSPESIYLTLQQITDKDLADKFLLQVYDWNWNVAIKSIAKNSELEIRNYSADIETAMLALVAQKQFDSVHGTSNSARESLVSFESTIAKQFAQAKDLKELFKIVIGIEPKSDLFRQWKALFTIDRESEISQDTIKLIQSPNSLIGWTASNVLRECNLSESNQSQLGTILESSNANDPTQNTRRWRIVHALGRSPSKKNANLLFNALENDSYHWVRYGAARALVEMAAVTSDKYLREYILGTLHSMVENLKQNVLEKIGKTVFYKDAYGSWDETPIYLLEKIKGLQKHDQYTEKWQNIIIKYKEKKWKNNS